jgi:hypothetical protein
LNPLHEPDQRGGFPFRLRDVRGILRRDSENFPQVTSSSCGHALKRILLELLLKSLIKAMSEIARSTRIKFLACEVPNS